RVARRRRLRHRRTGTDRPRHHGGGTARHACGGKSIADGSGAGGGRTRRARVPAATRGRRDIRGKDRQGGDPHRLARARQPGARPDPRPQSAARGMVRGQGAANKGASLAAGTGRRRTRRGARRPPYSRLRRRCRSLARPAAPGPLGDDGGGVAARLSHRTGHPARLTVVPMPRYRITVEYDGTPFVGWQMQENGRSVQQALTEALERLTQERVAVHGAGRTDAGVHALGQVAHFDLARDRDERTIRDGLNFHLKPEPVSVLRAERAADDFHARFDATRRRYVYRILNRRAPPALDRDRVWWVPAPLDAAAMDAAARVLVGRHDFTTFRS